MWQPYEALYIHVPFCASRCFYCDFKTQACKRDDTQISQYVEQTILKIRRYAKAGSLSEVKTIYIGGGTPSFLGTKHLSSLLYALSLSINMAQIEELTLECNPESFTEELMKDMWALGVNRLSFGVQSFQDEKLKTIGRIHSSDQARSAIECASRRFSNISLDLMCGLPGQGIEDFAQDINEVLKLPITHISIYPLSIEPNTVLAHQIETGFIKEPDEDAQASMMQTAAFILKDAGFDRYEVASYAKNGLRSKHNQAYWTSKSYLGLGPGAVSMRQKAQVRERFDEDGLIERIEGSELLAENLMLAARLSWGISPDLQERAQQEFSNWHSIRQKLIGNKLVYECDGYLRPTDTGWLLGNELYGSLLALGEDS